MKYEDYDDFHKKQIEKREKEELERALKESRKLAEGRVEKKGSTDSKTNPKPYNFWYDIGSTVVRKNR